MKNRYIEKNLSEAVSSMLPKDGFERLSKSITFAERKEVKLMKNNTKKSSNLKRIISISVAACLVLVLGIFGFGYYRDNYKITSIVDIDINPSIELSANGKDRVLKAEGINEDAKKVLNGLELEGTELNTAVNAIVGSMYKNGYLNADRSRLLVTVQNEDKAKAENLQKSISLSIDNSLKGYKLSGGALNQTVTDISPAEELAKKHNISKGKAMFIIRLCQLDKSLKAEELVNLSLNDIIKKADKKILYELDITDPDDDLKDIYEEVIESIPPEDVVEEKLISAERAKEIALKDAGVNANSVELLKSELDKEGAAYIYEIDFNADKYEYEYDINAKDGSIIKKDKKYDDDYKGENLNQVDPAVISADKAKEIALNHAGLKISEVGYVKAELDKDDGLWEYDVEFKKGNTEYEYTINGISGKILEFDKDIDD